MKWLGSFPRQKPNLSPNSAKAGIGRSSGTHERLNRGHGRSRSACSSVVIEVTLPGTARYDRLVKRRRYQRAPVPEYWIVDLDARLVERWKPDDTRPADSHRDAQVDARPGAQTARD